MKNQLYTASEAREKLGGMAPSSFHRLVLAGKIRKVTPPNKKQGLYVSEDVDKIAEAMAQFVDMYTTNESLELVAAQSESDIKATVQIARQHFGERAYGLEKRMEWFKKEPEGDYVLKHDRVIVGYFCMKPVNPAAIEDHIFKPTGGVRTEDIERYELGKELECYVLGIATKLDTNGRFNRLYGAALISGAFERIMELGKQGIDIRRIWTTSQTVTGIKLSRDLGFEELGYIDNEHIKFMLDTNKSDHPLIRMFREELANYSALAKSS
jgi:hypothetical protein